LERGRLGELLEAGGLAVQAGGVPGLGSEPDSWYRGASPPTRASRAWSGATATLPVS
jgi:hypothetical protein